MTEEKINNCEFVAMCKSASKNCQKGRCHRFPLIGEHQTEVEFEKEFAKRSSGGGPFRTFEERRRVFGETWGDYKRDWQEEVGHFDEYGNEMTDGDGVDIFEPVGEEYDGDDSC